MTTESLGRTAEAVYGRLGEMIQRGSFPVGSRLPGERELAAQLGVSRATLRQALDHLEGEGIVARAAQRGWFVQQPLMGEPPSVLQSFSEMARSRGLIPHARVLLAERRTPSFDEATRLRIPASSPVFELRRLRLLDEVPACIDTNVISIERAPGVDEVDFTDVSLYDTLAFRCDAQVSRSSYTVQAEAASAATAGLLAIEPGSPVLVGREITYNQDGVPLLVGTMVYRGDAYRFKADLYRPATQDRRLTMESRP